MVKPWALRSYAVWSRGDKDGSLEADVPSTICYCSPNSCVGELFSVRLSYHSCSYGIVIGLCPFSPWATCIHKCLTLHVSRQSYFNCRNTLASGRRRPGWRRVYSHHYHLHCYRHRGLRACRRVSRLFDHTWAPLFTVCRLETSNKALCRRDSTAETMLPPHGDDKCLEH